MQCRSKSTNSCDRRLASTALLRSFVYAGGILPYLFVGAHAQIYEQGQAIDQYLNPVSYGTDIQPGITVLSRQHPDYDPIEVRLGPLVIQPSLSEIFGYDDNVTGTTNAHGSPLIETTGKVSAVDKMTDGLISAQGSASNFDYPSVSRQSYSTWQAGVTGMHNFGEDLLTVTASHSTLDQTPRDLNVPQLDSPIAYQVENLHAFYTAPLGRLQIQPGMDISYYSFDNGSVAGSPLVQSYRDRIVYYPNIMAKYEFATGRDLVLVVRDADASYTNTVAGLPTQNFNDVSVLGGLSYDVDGVINFRLLGGYEERTFSSRVYKTIQAPIVEGAVVWTPSDLTTVRATAARYITDTSAEGTISETETTLSLNVDHELFRNVILQAKGAFSDAAYVGEGSSQLYTAEFGATWKLNRLLHLTADYRFTERESGNAAANTIIQPSIYTIGENYKESLVRLQLGVDF